MTKLQVIRTMLVDDHSMIHQVVKQICANTSDIKLVAQCNNGMEAISLCAELELDLILMDIIMPGMDGIEATRIIHEKYPTIKIVALSSFQEDENIRAMLESGASGYILKGALSRDLSNAIRTIQEGKAVFSLEVIQTLLDTQVSDNSFGLTEREIMVLKELVIGNTNNQIAQNLHISVSTVKYHLNNIQLKMKVNTRIEAIALAIKNNIIK